MSWVQCALSSMGTQTGVTVPNQALQAVLWASTAPYPASQIPLALGFEPFSIPLLSHQLGTGSSYTKTQKGSWGSQRAGEPLAALAPATGYLGLDGRVPQIRQSSAAAP